MKTMGSKRPLFGLSSKDILECNIAILGQLGVGKSALTVKFLTKRFIMEYDPNLEDTYHKTETVDGQDYSLKLMDTCDHSNGKKLERYLKWANGLVIAYSITNRSSFDIAVKLLQKITQYSKETGKDLPVMLVGNQTDLERYRTVSKNDGQETAQKCDCLFQETSAAEDYSSVEKLFHELIREINKSGDSQDNLQPLYISEDSKAGLLNPLTQGIGGMINRRGKSASTLELKSSAEKEPKFVQRRLPATFKIFNKRFNIFN